MRPFYLIWRIHDVFGSLLYAVMMRKPILDGDKWMLGGGKMLTSLCSFFCFHFRFFFFPISDS